MVAGRGYPSGWAGSRLPVVPTLSSRLHDLVLIAGGFKGNLIEANVMAKTSPHIDPHRVITLTKSQLAIYYTEKIEIVAPNGQPLTAIGKSIDKKAESLRHEMMIDNFYLLEDLIRSCGDEGLEISGRGALGLANMFWQAQEMIG